MDKRKILAVNATALAVAAAFGAPSPVVAADAVTAETSVQLYGHVDVSVDDITKGLSGRAGAVGRLGWQPDVSSNLSYFGLRGSHDVGSGKRIVFQIETQVE